jgi:hypothetical protein
MPLAVRHPAYLRLLAPPPLIYRLKFPLLLEMPMSKPLLQLQRFRPLPKEVAQQTRIPPLQWLPPIGSLFTAVAPQTPLPLYKRSC